MVPNLCRSFSTNSASLFLISSTVTPLTHAFEPADNWSLKRAPLVVLSKAVRFAVSLAYPIISSSTVFLTQRSHERRLQKRPRIRDRRGKTPPRGSQEPRRESLPRLPISAFVAVVSIHDSADPNLRRNLLPEPCASRSPHDAFARADGDDFITVAKKPLIKKRIEGFVSSLDRNNFVSNRDRGNCSKKLFSLLRIQAVDIRQRLSGFATAAKENPSFDAPTHRERDAMGTVDEECVWAICFYRVPQTTGEQRMQIQLWLIYDEGCVEWRHTT